MKIKTTSLAAAAFLIVCWLGTNNVYAGNGTFTGLIAEVLSGPAFGSMVVIAVTGGPAAVATKAACSTDTNYSFVFDTNDTFAKNTMAIVLTAYASGKTVFLYGANACPSGWAVERLQQIQLQ